MTPLNTTKKFTDSNYLPKSPGTLGRSLFQGIVDEVVSYINGTITTELGLKALNTSIAPITASVTAVTNTASLSGNGWFKDKKTGFLLQWGNGSCSASGNSVVTFPIAFPVACFNVIVGIGAGNATATLAANAIFAANFQINNQDAYTRAYYYIAIGH